MALENVVAPRGLTQYRRVTILRGTNTKGTGPQRRSTAIFRRHRQAPNRTLEVLKSDVRARISSSDTTPPNRTLEVLKSLLRKRVDVVHDSPNRTLEVLKLSDLSPLSGWDVLLIAPLRD